MITLALAFGGFILLYICWAVSISSWSRLTELGIEHKKSSSTYFDSVMLSGFFGLLVSRIVWMFTQMSIYQDVPWGILPYSRSASEFVWFTVFPWRFFRVTEGIHFPVLWIIMGILTIFTVFIPTISLARRLRLEKRGIMRAFIIKNAFCSAVALLYFALLTNFAR